MARKYYCIELNCSNEICYKTWEYGQGRCQSCAAKKNIDIAKNNLPKNRRDKNNGNYIDGRTNIKYYCIEPYCNNKICYSNWSYGKKRCNFCSNSGKNNGRYIDNRTKIKHYCIEKDCNNIVSGLNKRCRFCASKRKWEDKDFRRKTTFGRIKGLQIKPNKPETQLNELLQRLLPREYKINVRANIMILGKRIPDFVNVNGQKKLIELFGDYWHSKKRIGRTKKQEEQRKIKYFKRLGYKTLIIWEHELKNLYKVEKKVLIFNSKSEEEV